MASEKSVVVGAVASFLLNAVAHTYEVTRALIMVPPSLIVAAFCIPFFPVWAIVIFGLLKRRKWSFQLGLVISIIGIVVAAGGAITGLALAMVDAIVAFVIDLVQIAFCAYGLRTLKW